MSSIDERVVRMKFDNAQFERGVQTTQKSLAELEKSLQLKQASKGLDDVAAKAKSGLGLDHLASGVSGLASSFNTMSVVAITALSNITSKAVNAGLTVVKSLTIGPIGDGFSDYNEKLTSVQTIMNGTGESMKTVSKYFTELDTYADKTIYNLSDMTSSFAKFTNAGVGMDVSVPAIKGIANMVALAGQGASAASIAMYNLSQSISGGFLTTTDYKSLNLANVATKEWKGQMIKGAEAAGTLKKNSKGLYQIKGGKKAYTDQALFNEALADGWATSDVLLKVLGDYGDTTTAIGKKAQAAAQDVRSLPMMLDTLKAAAGTGWTDTFEILFGNVEESKVLWTGLTNTIGGGLDKISDARNKVLGEWKKAGGRTALIEGLKNAFSALGAVIKPIKDAFKDIFPPITGKRLAELSKSFQKFTAGLKIGGETADRIKRTFSGVFAILDIGRMIVVEAAKMLMNLFGVAGSGTGGFLELTAKIGDWVKGVRDAIKNGDGLHKFFSKLGAVLAIPIKVLQAVGGAIKNFVTDFKIHMGPLGDLIDKIKERWSGWIKLFTGGGKKKSKGGPLESLKKQLSGFNKFMEPILSKIKEGWEKIGPALKEAMGNIDPGMVMDALSLVLVAGIGIMLKKFTGSLKDGLGKLNPFEGFKAGFVGRVDKVLGGVTDTLKAMQASLKADILLKIAGALLLLTVAVVALSMIPSEKLTKALAAISVMFLQLTAGMKLFSGVSSTKASGKMVLLAGSLILLAIAISILASAVKKLGDLSWEELAKGLVGVTVLIVGLSASTRLMSKQNKGMMRSAAGLILLAIAIKILTSAVEDFSEMNWEEISKGLTGVATLLIALGLFNKIQGVNKIGIKNGAGFLLMALGMKVLASAVKDMAEMTWSEMASGLAGLAGGMILISGALRAIPPDSPLRAAAIYIVAASLKTIGNAIKSMGQMKWDEIARGMTVMAGALTLISAALYAIPPTALLSAAAIFITAKSLTIIGDALESLGDMTWSEVAKSLTMLAGSLTLLALALAAMEAGLPGAAALVVAAYGLKLMVPPLMALGTMSWSSIGKSLTMLAASLTILAAAAILLIPAVPVFIGLGVAMTLFGGGLFLAGAGLALFTGALVALVALGAGAGVAISLLLTTIANKIPELMKKFAEGLGAFITEIAKQAPKWKKSFSTILQTLLDVIVENTPKIAAKLATMLYRLLVLMKLYVPKLIDAGSALLVSIIDGFTRNIPKIATAVTKFIVAMLKAIGDHAKEISDAGIKLMVSLINGLATAIDEHSDELNAAGGRLASAIVTGAAKGIAGGAKSVVNAAIGMAKGAITGAMDALDADSPSKEFEKVGKYAVQGFAKGLTGNRDQITAAYNLMRDLLKTARANAKEDIKASEERLIKLNKHRSKNKKAIKEEEKDLKQARKEYVRAGEAYDELTKKRDDDRDRLRTMADKNDKLTESIRTQTEALKQAKQVRDDYARSIREQYDDMPDLIQKTDTTEATTVKSYADDLRRSISDVHTFNSAITRLRDMGLNDTMYMELLAKGPDALPFLQQILDGGTNSVKELNKLSSDLANEAKKLGNTASQELYQAGVDAAQGLLDGLVKDQQKLEAAMTKLAKALAAAIKKELGIKSPSLVFKDIGGNVTKGLAEGMTAYSSTVEKAAEGVGQDAILALTKTISGMSDLIQGDLDLAPTITPVLDLTDVKRQAASLGSLLGASPVSVSGTYSGAQAASVGYDANKAAGAMDSKVEIIDQRVSFTQNNTSPKALSPAEIYRQTKNQLSVAKGAVR